MKMKKPLNGIELSKQVAFRYVGILAVLMTQIVPCAHCVWNSFASGVVMTEHQSACHGASGSDYASRQINSPCDNCTRNPTGKLFTAGSAAREDGVSRSMATPVYASLLAMSALLWDEPVLLNSTSPPGPGFLNHMIVLRI